MNTRRRKSEQLMIQRYFTASISTEN